jgi:fructose-specific component phosphotransferase system IIB-like protein
MPTKIQLRRSTASEWTSANPTLASGEVGFETDTKKFKIGDGSSVWSSLAYSSVTSSAVNDAVAAHADRTDNPHSVTKAQVGLGSVDNTSDLSKPISTAVQAALDEKYDASNPDSFVDAAGASAAAPVQSVAGKTGSVTLTKSDVGLGSVDNVSAASLRDRATHTGTQAAASISDFDSAAKSAVISSSVSDGDTTHAPSGNAVFDAISVETSARETLAGRVTDIENDYGHPNGLCLLDGSGKISSAVLPGSVLEYHGTWNASTNTPTLADGSSANAAEDAGHIYRVSVAGTQNLGSGSITFAAGDDVILSDSLIWERSPGGQSVISVNGYQGDVILDSLDIAVSPSVAGGSTVQAALEGAVQRANHTGTQLASTISDFTSAVQAVTIDASKIDGGSVSNAEFATLDGITTGVSIQSQIDGKQASITGAASSITSTDLTASRAVVSDSSGKVAVSSTTASELGFVSGVTSAIQTQINGKQATVTGAASSITTSNLTASRALASDSSGKVAVSSTTASELDFVSGVTSGIQSQLDGKQATITGAATTITSSNLTASRAVVSDSSGKVAISATTATEIGYLSGVTSSVQTQFSNKANLSGGNTFTGKQVMTPSATDPGLNLGSVATDPSAPANGDVWYNSTSGDVKIRQGGVTVVERNIIGKQVLTSGTTYTPTAGAKYVDAILVGGGGGGGGVTGANASVGAGGGGGSGAVLTVFTALTGAATYTIAIGAFGAGGSGTTPTAGTAGTATTLTIGATTYTAPGGSGGAQQTAGTAAAIVAGGAGAAVATGGTINLTGQSGYYGLRSSGTVGVSGRGADSPYGAGGASVTAAGAGNAATGYGAGGSGGFSTANVNRAGGNGAPGVIIITEYA